MLAFLVLVVFTYNLCESWFHCCCCYYYCWYYHYNCYFLSHLLIMCADTVPIRTVNRQCSSGLQAVADVAAALKAGFYDIGKNTWKFGSCHCYLSHELMALSFLLIITGIGVGLESMTADQMDSEGSVNPKVYSLSQVLYYYYYYYFSKRVCTYILS